MILSPKWRDDFSETFSSKQHIESIVAAVNILNGCLGAYSKYLAIQAVVFHK